jgi:hypothetical protein
MSPLDAAFVLDTTGSMGVQVNELRHRLHEIASEVSSEVARARLGVVCFKDHGPEGEEDHYLTLSHPLTSRPEKLDRFLRSRRIAPGEGGGGAEAVECALHAAGELKWRDDARKVVVLVGDKPPHGAGMDSLDECPRHVDWRDEVEKLARLGVRVHAVLVGSHLEARRSFEWMADSTDGKFLELRSPKDLGPLLVSVCLAEAGRDVERFAAKLDAAGRLTASRRELLHALAG